MGPGGAPWRRRLTYPRPMTPTKSMSSCPGSARTRPTYSCRPRPRLVAKPRPRPLSYELRRAEPLIDLRFFRSAPFSGATVIAVCAFAALGGFLFLNTLYLQDVRGYSGLYLLPMAAMIVVWAAIS